MKTLMLALVSSATLFAASAYSAENFNLVNAMNKFQQASTQASVTNTTLQDSNSLFAKRNQNQSR